MLKEKREFVTASDCFNELSELINLRSLNVNNGVINDYKLTQLLVSSLSEDKQEKKNMIIGLDLSFNKYYSKFKNIEDSLIDLHLSGNINDNDKELINRILSSKKELGEFVTDINDNEKLIQEFINNLETIDVIYSDIYRYKDKINECTEEVIDFYYEYVNTVMYVISSIKIKKIIDLL